MCGGSQDNVYSVALCCGCLFKVCQVYTASYVWVNGTMFTNVGVTIQTWGPAASNMRNVYTDCLFAGPEYKHMLVCTVHAAKDPGEWGFGIRDCCHGASLHITDPFKHLRKRTPFPGRRTLAAAVRVEIRTVSEVCFCMHLVGSSFLPPLWFTVTIETSRSDVFNQRILNLHNILFIPGGEE